MKNILAVLFALAGVLATTHASATVTGSTCPLAGITDVHGGIFSATAATANTVKKPTPTASADTPAGS